MIKAVIFDCFGVLVTSSYEPFKDTYFGEDNELRRSFLEIEDRSSRGEITLDEAEQGFATLAGISFEQTKRELAVNPRNEELLAFIAVRLQPKYKIGFVSNVAKDRTKELFTDADLELFDDIILSFKVGLAKPDPKLYLLAAERLAVDVEECLFVDDVAAYIEGAVSVGMKAIKYVDFEQFKRELEEYLHD